MASSEAEPDVPVALLGSLAKKENVYTRRVVG